MSNFKERKDAFENKFVHDQQMQFKIEVHRNKMLGAWAAELLNLSEIKKEDYIKQVVRSDLEESGDEDVFRKLKGDLEGIIKEDSIRKKMNELYEEAKAKLKN